MANGSSTDVTVGKFVRENRQYTGPGHSAAAWTHFAVWGASAGTRTVMFGIPRIRAMSSFSWWVAPSWPTVIPAWLQKSFTGSFVYAMFWRITLYVWATPKTAYVDAKAILPAAASPAAIEIMFCSLIPTLNSRSGNFFPNSRVLIDSVVSAPTTTTFGFFSPSSIRAFAKYDRWDSIFHGIFAEVTGSSRRVPRGPASAPRPRSRLRGTGPRSP